MAEYDITYGEKRAMFEKGKYEPDAKMDELRKRVTELEQELEAVRRKSAGWREWCVEIQHRHTNTHIVEARTEKEAKELAFKESKDKFGNGDYHCIQVRTLA
jgi:uncharacterized NAD(P)/FAD-binding protein YdhS